MKNEISLLLSIQIVGQRFWAWGLLVLVSFIPSMVWAQQCGGWGQYVTTYKSCAGPGETNCSYTPSITYYPLPACPPPPPPLPPPPPPPKTPDQIEWEQHVKFCREFPAQIGSAVGQCIGNAYSYENYFVGTQCSNVQSAEWTFKVKLKDMIDVGYSQTISPGPTCRADAALARDETVRRCKLDGDRVRAALAVQCSDVR
jgi:hypothetical protein